MSGRAVRKALRQREAELALEPPPAGETSDHDESDSDSAPAAAKPSLFALLGGADDVSEPEDEDEEPEEEEGQGKSAVSAAPAAKRKPKKKKKGKGKGKGKAVARDGGVEDEDEIDKALRQLNMDKPETARNAEVTKVEHELSTVLKIDSRDLDAANEMRKLFGKAAQAMGDEEGGGRRDARMGGRGRMMIPGAVGGRGLTSVRRNTFIQSKDQWPTAPSGGLGMEVVLDSSFDSQEGTTEFRFVHSKGYQDVQRQFMICVASMDPDRLIQLLQHNPYHISTLLQVSEILTAQRDFTLSGDLLERALFSMGRSLHSSFAQKLAEGRARLSFSRPENREFYLAVWRYIKNLSLRGTWRTAETWARMLLALDPSSDPYEISLLLDFLALKSRQPEHILALAESADLSPKYVDCPNIAFSAALAQQMLGHAEVAREYLAKAITRFPWIPAMLYPELGVDVNLPPALWGLQPPEGNPRQSILATLYVSRSKDLWKDPDATTLFVDVASTIYNLPRKPLLPVDAGNNISRSFARHVLLTDLPAATTLLPRSWTTAPTTSYDPLPPPAAEDIISYTIPPSSSSQPRAPGDMPPGIPDANDRNAVLAFLRSMLPWMAREDFGADGAPPEEVESAEALRRLTNRIAQDYGVNVEELVRREIEEGRAVAPEEWDEEEEEVEMPRLEDQG